MIADLDVACHLNVVAPDLSPRHLDAALAMIAETGFRRVVLPPLDPDVEVTRLAAAFARAGLTPITIAVQGLGADVSSIDAGERQRGAAALRRCVDLTRALGGDQMNGVPYGPFGRASSPPSADQRSWAAEAVGEDSGLRPAGRSRDDVRSTQSLRDGDGQHGPAGDGVRGDERIRAPPHPPRQFPPLDRGARYRPSDPLGASQAGHISSWGSRPGEVSTRELSTSPRSCLRRLTTGTTGAGESKPFRATCSNQPPQISSRFGAARTRTPAHSRRVPSTPFGAGGRRVRSVAEAPASNAKPD